jgi:hypothetical protein
MSRTRCIGSFEVQAKSIVLWEDTFEVIEWEILLSDYDVDGLLVQLQVSFCGIPGTSRWSDEQSESFITCSGSSLRN